MVVVCSSTLQGNSLLLSIPQTAQSRREVPELGHYIPPRCQNFYSFPTRIAAHDRRTSIEDNQGGETETKLHTD